MHSKRKSHIFLLPWGSAPWNLEQYSDKYRRHKEILPLVSPFEQAAAPLDTRHAGKTKKNTNVHIYKKWKKQ